MRRIEFEQRAQLLAELAQLQVDHPELVQRVAPAKSELQLVAVKAHALHACTVRVVMKVLE